MIESQQISFFQVNPRSRSRAKRGVTQQAQKSIHTDDLFQTSINMKIDPLLFKGLKVFIDLPDGGPKKTAENVLKNSGASIIQDPKQATDIIIINDNCKNDGKSAGTSPARINNRIKGKNNIHGKKQHVISSAQIPWAFASRPQNAPVQHQNLTHESTIDNTINNANQNSSSICNSNCNEKLMIVVADASHKARPIYCALDALPELRQKAVPKGCTFSPFINDEEIKRILHYYREQKRRSIEAKNNQNCSTSHLTCHQDNNALNLPNVNHFTNINHPHVDINLHNNVNNNTNNNNDNNGVSNNVFNNTNNIAEQKEMIREKITLTRYCDICKKMVHEEYAHRNSLEHRQNVAKLFSEVDELALSFPEIENFSS
ncbi:hypothetical protein TRFO_23298 [Tritrichomonas foetus]|uniref:DBF4-type domain-containing protein n=1 Tax=Tritrichomonas foetus TaxID=1144522 RepID=A0A1J4K9S8_9EUKA|nr:hypothetical protein TRFO_23298 [Tritrichomonas foetus]|eukprot:OHT08225.1 hypothetical protein TRFO_23298 [Tritrichomonas foetus]